MKKSNRIPVFAALIGAAIVLPVAWTLLSPLWINQRVDEPAPAAAAAMDHVMTETVISAPISVTASAMMTHTDMPRVMTDTAMSMPMTHTDMPRAMTDTDMSMPMTETVMAGPMTPTVAAPRVLGRGSFYSVVHEGKGRAEIQQLPDGSRVLRFEDFEVLNGPDLYVYLVPVAPVASAIAAEIPGSVSLGRLKGNIGNQNYALPANLDLAGFKSVVVWCQAFKVPFAAATLER